MGCGRPLCRRDNGPSSGNPGRPTGQVCAAQVEVRPHNAEWSPGRASHHQISPIKCGLQPIMTAQGRIRGRMPILLSLSAAGRSNPGNPGFPDYMELVVGGKPMAVPLSRCPAVRFSATRIAAPAVARRQRPLAQVCDLGQFLAQFVSAPAQRLVLIRGGHDALSWLPVLYADRNPAISQPIFKIPQMGRAPRLWRCVVAHV